MVNLPGNILILTGPPGAGKTTASRSLAAESEGPAVHLHSDDFWHFIKKGAILPFLSNAHQQNEIVLGVVAGAAEGYARGGYFVIVDGIVGPWFLHLFRKLKCPVHYIVIRPPLDDAIERCRLRDGETLMDPGPITHLYTQFSRLDGGLENHVIQTAGCDPSAALTAISAGLVSGRFQLAS